MNGPTLRRYLQSLTAEPGDRPLGPLSSIVGRTPLDRWLWLAVLVAIAADLATTVGGLEVGFAESNPVGTLVLETVGVLGLVGLKAGAVAIGLSVAAAVVRAPDRIAPDYVTLVVPTALATVWLLAATWNAYLLVTALTGL
ncbi:hypothetical protein [Natrinema versiforme]|uniref:DUF5658 domain-containing protein n=1 Tax=Natrinema versiforme JCM 10478 TaxID=1227496 RepID=L9Y2J5_9EURY|nr:hypothetical protein [Natrinema versiforme]ELY68309.1 hypothetical protein C489_07690 [Natrinema versiforme JCM 10478]